MAFLSRFATAFMNNPGQASGSTLVAPRLIGSTMRKSLLFFLPDDMEVY
jgi:hypothetical protein